jgi:predicted Zn-dependent protease
MKSVSRLALGAALAIGAAGALFTAPADAQRAPRNKGQQNQAAAQAQAQAQGPALNLNAQERAVLVPLEAAARGTDRAAQDAALAAAQGVVRGADARYAFARYQLAIAVQRNDNAMLTQALDAVLASGRAPASELPTFLNSRAQIAMQARDHRRAEQLLTQLQQLQPNDVSLMASLAQLRTQQGNVGEGLRMLQQAIAAQQAAGRPVEQSWYQFGLRHATDSNDPAIRANFMPFARGLLGAYGTPQNWRQVLVTYRERANLDAQANIDLSRLMLASRSLAGERDYYDFANALNQGGYPAEAKAVLDAGVSSRMVDAAKSPFRELIGSVNGRIAADRAELPSAQRSALAAATGTPALRTGDAFLGHGRYTDAIALYQAALQKGGTDANVVNTRLGIAYALAGQRAQAEAAFRAVTGPRADIAALWMLWLAQRPAA